MAPSGEPEFGRLLKNKRQLHLSVTATCPTGLHNACSLLQLHAIYFLQGEAKMTDNRKKQKSKMSKLGLS